MSGHSRGTGIDRIRQKGRSGFYIAAAAALVADQISKVIVKAALPIGDSVSVIPGAFSITSEKNFGAAFGMLQGSGYLLAIVSLVAIFAIVKFRMERSRSRLLAISLGLLLGGAVGNLIDRLAFGYVFDFLDFHWWPIFNVADAAITVGGALLVIYSLVISRHSPEQR